MREKEGRGEGREGKKEKDYVGVSVCVRARVCLFVCLRACVCVYECVYVSACACVSE